MCVSCLLVFLFNFIIGDFIIHVINYLCAYVVQLLFCFAENDLCSLNVTQLKIIINPVLICSRLF